MERARLKDIQLAITHDHTYTSSEGEIASLEEPLGEELITHEEQHQELLSHECEDEKGGELLGEIEKFGILVEVGKTKFN